MSKGPVWCLDCGFKAENKEISNPFLSINEKIAQIAIDVSSSKEEKSIAKYLISSMQRQSNRMDRKVADEEAIKILRSLRSDYVENKEYYDESEYIFTVGFIDRFLPKEPTEIDILNFLNTLDFSSFKSKYQAISKAKDHFNGNVDGNLVRSVIDSMNI
jgi:hypothetical protein